MVLESIVVVRTFLDGSHIDLSFIALNILKSSLLNLLEHIFRCDSSHAGNLRFVVQNLDLGVGLKPGVRHVVHWNDHRCLGLRRHIEIGPLVVHHGTLYIITYTLEQQLSIDIFVTLVVKIKNKESRILEI